MRTRLLPCLPLVFSVCVVSGVEAGEKVQMDTTYVKANKELPKILFVVPWQDLKPGKNADPTLVIHSLYGDLFDPVVPREPIEQKQERD
jgi:hypothetical protein